MTVKKRRSEHFRLDLRFLIFHADLQLLCKKTPCSVAQRIMMKNLSILLL